MVIGTYIIYESLEGLLCYSIIGGVGIPVSLRHNGLSKVQTGDLCCNRAWRHQRPTNNMFKVWHNSAPFGSRPIGGAVEVLLTKVVNWQ